MSFSSDLQRFANRLKKSTRVLEQKIVSDGLDIVKSKTPVRTGTLRDAWEIQNRLLSGPVIVNDIDYGIFVENGTDKMTGAYMLRRTLYELSRNIKQGKYND